jgi:hypothetical protein
VRTRRDGRRSLRTTSERIRRRSARSRIAHEAGADDRDVRVIGSSARTVADPGRLEQVPYEPEDRSTPELLRDWGAIMRELRARDVVRTNNNPVGDIAEAIVAEHYGGERGSFAQAGWDVRTPQGERIQVKAMRQTAGAKRRNVSPIRDRDYDFVVIVIFDEDFVLTEGLRLSRDVVEELFHHRDYVNGRIITVTNVLRAGRASRAEAPCTLAGARVFYHSWVGQGHCELPAHRVASACAR